MKKSTLVTLAAVFTSLLAAPAFAEGETGLAALTASVDLTAISTAMAVVFGGMITVGIFLKGGSMIARRLGWR
ncbi:hypothetical protein [Methylomonas rhizoryzae]|uniref:hypothetical protein n=1 Tax=Methylomonas rhizoryzae TaxID=2608981 RepID=UPI0012325E89|nr:hypothetical protein [Methylomonas rhizoryzae]